MHASQETAHHSDFKTERLGSLVEQSTRSRQSTSASSDSASLHNDKPSTFSPILTQHFPPQSLDNLLHKAVWGQDTNTIVALLSDNTYKQQVSVNVVDAHGNTPVMLAVKRCHVNQSYIDIVRLLLSLGADPMIADRDGWTCVDHAIAQQNAVLVDVLFTHLDRRHRELWVQQKPYLVSMLRSVPDFYMEISWEFESSVIPFINKLAPSDTYKVWKKGGMLRLDTTLAGWSMLRSKRRNLSLLFRGETNDRLGDIVLINRSRQIVSNVLEEFDQEEKRLIVQDLLQSNPTQGDVRVHDFQLIPCLSWSKRPIEQQVGPWIARKYDFKSTMTLLVKKKGRRLCECSYEDYFSENKPSSARSSSESSIASSSSATSTHSSTGSNESGDTSTDTDQTVTGSMWVTENFPLTLRQMRAVLRGLAPGNPSISKLQDFLDKATFEHLMSDSTFPVKVHLPLMLSIRAVITFTKLVQQPIEDEVFQIPSSYAVVSRKEAQKTLTSPNKRVMLANLTLAGSTSNVLISDMPTPAVPLT